MSLTRRRLLPQRRSESRFLAVQAENAKTAMSQTLHDMNETLKGMVNVSSCAKQHPWLVTGSAVTVGFVTGAALTSSRRKNIKAPRSNSAAELQPCCKGQETVKTRKSFLFSTLGTVLAGILKTVVQSMLAAAVVAKDRVETHSPHDSAGAAGRTEATTG